MPKMTHWNSPDPIDVAPEKAAVYRAQGWVSAGRAAAAKPEPTTAAPKVEAMTTASVEEQSEPAPKKAPAKKSTSKKAAKKS